MAKYIVTIKETLEERVLIEAEDVIQAQEEVEDRYYCGDIELDSENYCGTDFSIKEATEEEAASHRRFDGIEIGRKGDSK